jgi:haloalkane dehalogenase
VLTVAQHIATARRVADLLELETFSVVGHDSGGMIARYAFVDDPRLRSMVLIDTEQPSGLAWRFKMFLVARHLPGIASSLGWIMGRKRLRRNPLVLGGAFANPALLDGEFDEFFLRPINHVPARRNAAVRLLKNFDEKLIPGLTAVHPRITVPVKLVWGEKDPFFPVAQAKAMVSTFPNASLDVIAGASLFSHEEKPAEVAVAILPGLLG